MGRWRSLLSLCLLCASLSAGAEHTTYDPLTGIARIPSVKVGATTYRDVTLQLVGTTPRMTLALREATAGTPSASGTTGEATYDEATGVLSLPIVKIGNEAYRVTLTNLGHYRFQVDDARALPPTVAIHPVALGAGRVSGHVYAIDPGPYKVVLYAQTNQYYVQPFITAPFTAIAADGSWTNATHPWNRIVALLVDPTRFVPSPTSITHPSLEAGVIAWSEYPSTGPAAIEFSGRSWGIKTTGLGGADQRFDPGPNYWHNGPDLVSVGPDGLRLRIRQVDGKWVCSEVHLRQSLGYGTYTVRIKARLDQLDRHTVAAPLFIYASPSQELDNEYSGSGGLVTGPYNAQFVAQPYHVPGNIVRYLQPAVEAFSSQIAWYRDRVVFRTWKGWSSTPAAGDLIREWTYTGPDIPVPGAERVRINLWLNQGLPPSNGVGDEMLIASFTFEP